MKRKLLLFSVILIFVFAAGQSRSYAGAEVGSTNTIYEMTSGNEYVKFIFDEQKHKKSEVESVCIAGTFNQWTKGHPDWEMSSTGQGIWELTVPLEVADIPGNSGYAEFKFHINGKEWIDPLPDAPDGYVLMGNNVLLYAEGDETLEEVVQRNAVNARIANTPKLLEDFDPDNIDDRKMIANFRGVPGTSMLFRSYNPCRTSRDYDVTVRRLEYVNEFLESYGVKSIISVSDDYGDPPKFTVSDYIQRIIDNGNFFFAGPSYSFVYYESDTEEFYEMITDIVQFIIMPENEGPFLVHCKIGTDRTGVVSAILAAFSGAGWEEIVVDYEKSNEAGIEEFRSPKLLAYSFEHLLQDDPSSISNLQQAITDRFVDQGYLTAEEVEVLRNKLK